MPKKTKRQKIHAKMHREPHLNTIQQLADATSTSPAQEGSRYSLPNLPRTVTSRPIVVDSIHLPAIKADLIKTVVLTILCCAILVGLSFVWH